MNKWYCCSGGCHIPSLVLQQRRPGSPFKYRSCWVSPHSTLWKSPLGQSTLTVLCLMVSCRLYVFVNFSITDYFIKTIPQLHSPSQVPRRGWLLQSYNTPLVSAPKYDVSSVPRKAMPRRRDKKMKDTRVRGETLR